MENSNNENGNNENGASVFYPWARTFSYNADVTMVISVRDRGKTFGIRMAAMDDAIKRGHRFVEVVRYKNELPEVIAGYFDKLAMLDKFSSYEFRTEGRKGFYRPKANDTSKKSKEPWIPLCYFIALSEAQNAKKRTYVDVRYIIFDEALIEPGLYLRYLPREWQVLANVVDTVTRESGTGEGIRPHLVMCSNSVDLVNPYFAAWGINDVPPVGYSWHANHHVLLHYEDPSDIPTDRSRTTLAGRMVAGTDEAKTALSNEFIHAVDDDIAPKPSGAKFWIGLVFRGQTFGIWIDWLEGFYYVTPKIPSDARTVYSLTRKDNSANRLIARRATPAMRALVQGYDERMLRFDSIATRESLLDALSLFGVA